MRPSERHLSCTAHTVCTIGVRYTHHFWRDLRCQVCDRCAKLALYREASNSVHTMSERSTDASGGSAFFDRLKSGPEPLFEQIDRNAKSLLQSALTRLDVVSREEFDAQTAVLKRTRERLEALERQLALLDESLRSHTTAGED